MSPEMGETVPAHDMLQVWCSGGLGQMCELGQGQG